MLPRFNVAAQVAVRPWYGARRRRGRASTVHRRENSALAPRATLAAATGVHTHARAYRYARIPALNGAAEGAGGPQQRGAAASSASFLRTGVSRCGGSVVGAAWDACGTGARRGEWCLDGGRRRGRRGTAVCVHGVGNVAGCRLKICGGRQDPPPAARVGPECGARPGVRTRRIRASTDRWPQAGTRGAMRGRRAPRYRRGCDKFAPRLLWADGGSARPKEVPPRMVP